MKTLSPGRRAAGFRRPRPPSAAAHGFTPKHVFRHALPGFAAQLSADALEAIRRHPAVKYVELDGPVSAF
jgi:hypothetical protein